jgi:hypothetical protein
MPDTGANSRAPSPAAIPSGGGCGGPVGDVGLPSSGAAAAAAAPAPPLRAAGDPHLGTEHDSLFLSRNW